MAGPYSYSEVTQDALASGYTAGSTTATLTTGNFGTPTYKMILVLDPLVPAKRAAYECSVNGTAVTGMVLVKGPSVNHDAAAVVSANLSATHMAGLTDFTGTTANAAWTGWTPTYTGFSVTPTAVSRYLKIGRMCTVSFFCSANGTSNASTFTLTLPFAAANVANANFGMCEAVDNGGTATVGVVTTVQNSTTLNVYPTITRGNWTSSGAKRANFVLTYETAA